ncbi:hypothetical protein CLOSTASPAR_03783 [[Clostridium] asparagiforme DSM 15981]|uniref:Uncharacterized protein n=1 Tax=[Clostridium] asparagiforme DSM 15981 TaxID=518636 RepID=C0D3E2_9FIRM|nr:hypothetical protein CLOSTASPAR_03783 [[Clostridium] asparagiforme DSM 15981]
MISSWSPSVEVVWIEGLKESIDRTFRFSSVFRGRRRHILC